MSDELQPNPLIECAWYKLTLSLTFDGKPEDLESALNNRTASYMYMHVTSRHGKSPLGVERLIDVTLYVPLTGVPGDTELTKHYYPNYGYASLLHVFTRGLMLTPQLAYMPMRMTDEVELAWLVLQTSL